MATNTYKDIVLHSPEYDATAMPIQNLLEALKQNSNLVGKKVRMKENGHVGIVLCGQKVWGYNEEGKYTTVAGVKISDDRRPLGSVPCPVNMLEVLEDSDCK